MGIIPNATRHGTNIYLVEVEKKKKKALYGVWGWRNIQRELGFQIPPKPIEIYYKGDVMTPTGYRVKNFRVRYPGDKKKKAKKKKKAPK